MITRALRAIPLASRGIRARRRSTGKWTRDPSGDVMADKRPSTIAPSGAQAPEAEANEWPPWARRLATLVLAFHLAAVLAGAFAVPPSSMLQRAIADRFLWYYQLADLGHTYRYYAPEPGPTPVVTATIRYADGRPEETLRLPQRGILPRLRYQRQLALAYHLSADFRRSRHDHPPGEGLDHDHDHDQGQSAWARSYARHLARSHPGASIVTLYTQDHLIPDVGRVAAALARGESVDLDAEEFHTAPERIGEFPCEGL
ncbi:MAG: hypothetical protein AB7I30_02705 [Isosphaeraceae bacterium]